MSLKENIGKLVDKPALLESLQAAKMSQTRFKVAAISAVSAALSESEMANKTTQKDVYNCILKCAQYGMIPGQHCAIVKFGNRVQMIVMYQGILHRISQIEGLEVQPPCVIYAGDNYELPKRVITGDKYELQFFHQEQYKTDNLMFAYITWTQNGVREIKVLPKSRIDKIRDMAGSNSPAWRDSYDEMARKTVLLNAAKYMSLDPGLQSTIQDISSEEVEEDSAPESPEVVPPAKQLTQDIPDEDPLGVNADEAPEPKPVAKKTTRKRKTKKAAKPVVEPDNEAESNANRILGEVEF